MSCLSVGARVTKLRTHYDNLKVARDAPDFVIRAAYKTLSQNYHPDKNPGDARAAQVMSLINQSYEVLSDPVRRREHDQWIAREESKVRSQTGAQTSSQNPEPQAQQPAAKPERSLTGRMLMAPLMLIGRVIVAEPRLAVLALVFGGFWIWMAVTPDPPPPPGPKPYRSQVPATPSMIISQPPDPAIPSMLKKGEDYSRPSTAPNGRPWPSASGYVKGYPIDNDSGHSEVTVDNAQNDSDVFVKLVSLDEETAFPVRQFYIPAGSRFKMNKVTAGKYDIRYRDLNSGGLSRSESFEITETRTDEGIEYSGITMTLYKVEGGNFQTYDLSDGEF